MTLCDAVFKNNQNETIGSARNQGFCGTVRTGIGLR